MNDDPNASSLDAARRARLSRVGIVAIGRNEGERLQRCLRSLPAEVAAVAYVDSASTDGSVEFAQARGVMVVQLDRTLPFTAARARNAGIKRLRERHTALDYMLLIDGDCELVPEFVDAALTWMEGDAKLGVVCGRRREMSPDASVYNRLCDMEWNTTVGEASACGGDALFRLAAFDAAGGYDPTLIAGEEPELCVRLRGAGFRVRRIACEMTRHDAALHRFGQWWKRNVRAGHACAEMVHRHPGEAFEARMTRSNLMWGLGLPVTAITLAWPTGGMSLGLLVLYAVLAWRIRAYRMREHGDRAEDASLYGLYCALGKVPQAVGTLQFHANRLRGRQTALIEYKG